MRINFTLKKSMILLKKGLLLIIIFQFSIIFSQSKISKRELEKIFKKSIKQSYKSKVTFGSDSWKMCIEKDSAEMYLYENGFENLDCCRYINWTFYKSNKFLKYESDLCGTPLLTKIDKDNTWYEIDFIEDKDLTLIIKNKIKSEKFIVKEIQKRKDNLHIIKLIKI